MVPHTRSLPTLALFACLATACSTADSQGDTSLPDSSGGSCIDAQPTYAASPAAMAQAAHAMVEGTVESVVAEWEPLYLSDTPIDLADCHTGAPMLRVALSDVTPLRGASVPAAATVYYSPASWLTILVARVGHSDAQMEAGDTDPGPQLEAAEFLAQGQRVGLALEPRARGGSYLVTPSPDFVPYVVDNGQVLWATAPDEPGGAWRPNCGGVYVDYEAASGMSQDAMHAYLSDESAPNNAVSDLREGIDRAMSAPLTQRALCRVPVSADGPSHGPADSGL